MKEADIEELAAKLYNAKRRVYRRSLLELARRLGYEIERPELSEVVDGALVREARDHAERIARTYNRDLGRAGTQRKQLPNSEVEPELRKWANARQRKRARPTAITEAYTAHADATLSAFIDLGQPDVTFDFGGHPELGDAPPACDICAALIARNPWSLAEVVQIGNPHPGCRQDWHPNEYDQRALPPPFDVELGQTLGGIIGTDPLISRAGGRAEAVEFVASLRE
jgi:hypothetical protein